MIWMSRAMISGNVMMVSSSAGDSCEWPMGLRFKLDADHLI